MATRTAGMDDEVRGDGVQGQGEPEHEESTTDPREEVQRIDALIDQIPNRALREHVRKVLREFQQLVVERRVPRLAVVGRRGAGKSSLINAIMGSQVREVGTTRSMTKKAVWTTVRGSSGVDLELLDTRGFQEGADAESGTAAEAPPLGEDEALIELRSLFQQEPPDVVLFLVKAKEADAAIQRDLQALQEVVASVRSGTHLVPLIGLVTQCDEMDPKRSPLKTRDTAASDGERLKAQRVEEVVQMVRGRLDAVEGVEIVDVMGVSSYVEWSEGGDTMTYDERWNIDRLAALIFQHLPDQALYEWVRATRVQALRLKVARRLVWVTAGIAAGVGTIPIPVPLVHTGALTALQAMMVVFIAKLRGADFGTRAYMELLTALGLNVAAGLVARETFRLLASVVPFLGNVISGGIAYVVTRALGDAAILYFLQDERDPTVLRAAFHASALKAKRDADEDPNLA